VQARRVAALSGRRREQSTHRPSAWPAPQPRAQTVPRERGQTDRQAQEVGRDKNKRNGPEILLSAAGAAKWIDDVHRGKTVRLGEAGSRAICRTESTGRCDELDEGQVPRVRRVSKGFKGVASLLVSQRSDHLSHELPLKRMAKARVQAPTHSNRPALDLRQVRTASSHLSESEATMCESRTSTARSPAHRAPLASPGVAASSDDAGASEVENRLRKARCSSASRSASSGVRSAGGAIVGGRMPVGMRGPMTPWWK